MDLENCSKLLKWCWGSQNLWANHTIYSVQNFEQLSQFQINFGKFYVKLQKLLELLTYINPDCHEKLQESLELGRL